MAGLSSYVQTAFTGGEISQSAQGRMDLPAYKISLNVCFNAIPIESGAWMRRPGTRHVAPTRGGKPGKLIPFSFAQSFPYVMEFTDSFLRFTTGPSLVMTNDQNIVLSVSAANPAIVTTSKAHGWSTGNAVMFNAATMGNNNPALQNIQFTITVTGSTTFELHESHSGGPIDGSTIGPFLGGNIQRILEISTNYTSGSWATLRSVQAETRTILLNGTKPQVLQVANPPSQNLYATFTYGPSDFIDGPYLDPVAGSYMTSSALNGVVTLTLSFAAYDATKAYNIGDFVYSAGAGYKSITALNQNNTPAGSPSNWTAVNAGAAVNGGLGFVASDVGRLVRLLSEPVPWDSASTFVAGNIVSYPNGLGGNSYWTATGTIAANIQPGTSTSWALNATGATWTWAQITAVSGSGLIAAATSIGSMTGGGGLAAAFDGNTTKTSGSAANFTANISTNPAWTTSYWPANAYAQYGGFSYQARLQIFPNNSWPVWSPAAAYNVGYIVYYNGFVYTANALNSGVPPSSSTVYWTLDGAVSTAAPPSVPSLWTNVGPMSSPTFDVYVGQTYNSSKAIQYGVLYPSTDIGFANDVGGITINLRAKNSAPSSPSDGTLLGTTGGIPNTLSSITVSSSDQTTVWSYVWFEIVATYLQPLPDNGTHIFTAVFGVSQAQFFSPTTPSGSVVTAQIRGPALLYAQTIRTWRLGVYSDTTGWPTCGTYHEGRVWLGGVVSNRFDGGVSNGFNGAQLDFTPTNASGVVSGNNAISYICTGEDTNQLLWMTPDQQGILFGTKAGEWLISAPAQGPLSPINIKAVRVTKIGCANAEPRRAEHTLLILQKFGRKLVEYFADVFSGKFSAPNLSEHSKHLTVNGIAEIAYQQELAPIVWARRNDGSLIGATYKRDTLTTSQGPTIIGWHRHQLGSGRVVESICVGPSVGGNLDTLTMITNDPSAGFNGRHIEVMTDLLDEGFALNDCWFLDDAILATSALIQSSGGAFGSLQLNGLSAHNGKTVSAWIAGLDCGDYVVSNGSITVPFGDGVSGGTANGLFTVAAASATGTKGVVGFTYNSDGQLLRPVTAADTGVQGGPGWAKLGRQHRGAAQLYGAVNGSISFGTDFGSTLYPAKLLAADDITPFTLQQLWSGIYRDPIESDIDFDGMISWRISRPYPGFVIAVGGFMTRADA